MRSISLGMRLAVGAMCAALGLVRADVSGACSGGPGPVAIAPGNPDMPLVRFAAGELGILRPSLARSYLVVAYRTLVSLPLDPLEQGAALSLWAKRLRLSDPKYIDPTGQMAHPPESIDDAVKTWTTARTLIPGAAPVSVTTDFYSASDYTMVQNCLADSFHAAASRLRSLVTEVAPSSDEAREWLAAQDQVFANCAIAPQPQPLAGATAPIVKPIPAPLPGSSPARARSDREYQIASATFYAGNLADAERRFTVIGNDAASPYRARARYLVARVLMRSAATSPAKADLARRALAALDAIQADPSLTQIGPAAARYRTFVLSHLDPAARFRDASLRLATQPVGSGLEVLLDDYTSLLDRDASPLEMNAPDSDRLTAWIAVMKNPANGPAFERALGIYRRSPSPLWLVAALVSANDAKDPRLTPLLDAAIATPPSSPAYATLVLEWVRLARGRGISDRDVFAKLQESKTHLAPSVTLSTTNDFTLTSARLAPTLNDFAANSALVPAGDTEGGTGEGTQWEGLPTYPSTVSTLVIPAQVATLMQRLPLTAWRDAALSPSLVPEARGEVASAAWVRAILLGDLTAAHLVVPLAETANPTIATLLQKVDASPTPVERRLAFLETLLTAPRLGPDVHPWETTSIAPGGIGSWTGFLWCKVPPTAPLSTAAFLTNDDRARASAETRTLSALGSGATFVATEAVALASLAPRDPRLPQLLHLAVVATRYACRDDDNLRASRGAYQALHSKYPGSPWTKKTPYYFGGD